MKKTFFDEINTYFMGFNSDIMKNNIPFHKDLSVLVASLQLQTVSFNLP